MHEAAHEASRKTEHSLTKALLSLSWLSAGPFVTAWMSKARTREGRLAAWGAGPRGRTDPSAGRGLLSTHRSAFTEWPDSQGSLLLARF